MFQFRPGNEQFALNWFVFPNLIFVKSPYYSLFFYPKKWFYFFFLQNGQNYPTTAFTFLPMTNFFSSTKIFGRFHRFGHFFGRNCSHKKTQSMWKDIFLFFSDSWDFFWNSRKMPTKKKQISQQKKISLSPQRFFPLYGIKRGYQKIREVFEKIHMRKCTFSGKKKWKILKL